jgi:hypothetical protein
VVFCRYVWYILGGLCFPSFFFGAKQWLARFPQNVPAHVSSVASVSISANHVTSTSTPESGEELEKTIIADSAIVTGRFPEVRMRSQLRKHTGHMSTQGVALNSGKIIAGSDLIPAAEKSGGDFLNSGNRLAADARLLRPTERRPIVGRSRTEQRNSQKPENSPINGKNQKRCLT